MAVELRTAARKVCLGGGEGTHGPGRAKACLEVVFWPRPESLSINFESTRSGREKLNTQASARIKPDWG